MKIFKYEVPLFENFELEMPIDSKILSFQSQNGNLVLWAAVYQNSSLETRVFKLLGTGSDIDMDYVISFIGTVQQLNGNLVWHLFEVIKY
jgi:hypothetical protein